MDRRHQKRQRRAHRLAKRTRSHAHEPTETQVFANLAQGLDEAHPLPFLAHAAGMWHVLSTRGPDDPDGPDQIEFVQTLLEVDVPETTALLLAFATLSDDELLTRRIGQALQERVHRVPGWLADLDKVGLSRVARQTEPFGDGDQYWLELRWPDDTTLSLGALIDANWGLAFKDLIAIPDAIQAVEEIIAEHGAPDEGIVFVPIAPADVRTQVSEAIARSDMFFPPVETDSWPQGRPLLAWALRMLPEGGTGFPEHDLDESARRVIVDKFLSSSEAAGLGEHAADTVDSLVWFAGFNCGDPLRWSPLKIEQLMADWWHRKVIQPAEADRAMPTILRAFVGWCAERTGLGPRHRAESMAAIDRFEPQFLADIGTPRRNTALDLARAAAGLPLDDDWDTDGWDAEDEGPSLDEILARMVGGHDALATLDDRPLPEEPFDDTGIEPDILPAVRTVLALVEAEIATRGVPTPDELTTAARRLVARIARTDPAAWRRRARPESSALAVSYLLYDFNHLLRQRVLVKDLVASFHLSAAPASRIDTFRGALGTSIDGGDATLMSGAARAHVLDLRERWKDLW